MNSRDFAILLASWLKLPPDDVGRVLAALRRGALLPAQPGAALDPRQAATGLIGVMLASVDGGGSGFAHRCQEACAMSLQGGKDKDPLDDMARGAFCALVGASLGTKSRNGYLTFAEALGAALERHRLNIGTVELERVAVRIHGTDPVGVIEARGADGALEVFAFTPEGEVLPTDGLRREVVADRGALAGIAFLLDADRTRGVR